MSAATVGALVASRRPAHRVSWLLVVLGLSISASGFAFSYIRYGLVARPGAADGNSTGLPPRRVQVMGHLMAGSTRD